MFFKSIKAYRECYRKIEAGNSDPKMDVDFIGGKIEDEFGTIIKTEQYELV